MITAWWSWRFGNIPNPHGCCRVQLPQVTEVWLPTKRVTKFSCAYHRGHNLSSLRHPTAHSQRIHGYTEQLTCNTLNSYLLLDMLCHNAAHFSGRTAIRYFLASKLSPCALDVFRSISVHTLQSHPSTSLTNHGTQFPKVSGSRQIMGWATGQWAAERVELHAISENLRARLAELQEEVAEHKVSSCYHTFLAMSSCLHARILHQKLFYSVCQTCLWYSLMLTPSYAFKLESCWYQTCAWRKNRNGNRILV